MNEQPIPRAPRVPAEWTDDCQGKKDYDGAFVSISTRYWPRGGGFWSAQRDANGLQINERPFSELAPSAESSIILHVGGDEPDVELADVEFSGEQFENVEAAVEAWAAEQYARVTRALRREFSEQNVHEHQGCPQFESGPSRFTTPTTEDYHGEETSRGAEEAPIQEGRRPRRNNQEDAAAEEEVNLLSEFDSDREAMKQEHQAWVRERLIERMQEVGFALPHGDDRLDIGAVAYNVALAAVLIEAALPPVPPPP